MKTLRHPRAPRIGQFAVAVATCAITLTGTLADTPAAHAAAGVITVTNRADDGSPTSLRGAVDQINAEGGEWVVKLEGGTPYIINRSCQQGNLDDNHGGDLDLVSNSKVTFIGAPGARATITVACAGERAFDHSGVGTVRFQDLRITGGNTANGANGFQAGNRNGSSAQSGGAIRSTGKVELIFAEIDGNRTGNGGLGAPPLAPGAGGNGGDGGSGGAVFAVEITAFASDIHQNTSGFGGAGGNGVGSNQPGGAGGSGGDGALVANVITLTLIELTQNTLGAGGKGGSGLGAGAAGGDGGDGGSGGGLSGLVVDVGASTIARNSAGGGGGGGNGNGSSGGPGGDAGEAGGAIASTATVNRSTIHANAAGRSGLGGSGAPPGGNGAAGRGGGFRLTIGGDVTFSTITANLASTGANFYAPATTVLRASVVGEAQGGPSCNIAMDNKSYTVHDGPSCGGDIVLNPLGLAPLAENGGRTPTRLPIVGGGLVNLIPDDVCPSISTTMFDQRDQVRPNWRCEPGAVEVPHAGASMFVPLPPSRVFDTREPGPASGFVGGGTTRTVTFAGVGGVPLTGVTAVAFNLTIDQSSADGFVTVSPTGEPRPLASSLNTVRSGQTVPNLVIVPLGKDGRLDFFAQRGGHLLGDIVGYFQQASVATAGRIIPLNPARVFDTREPGPASGKIVPGGVLTVDVTGVAGIPESGVSAVVINLTGTDATAAGYVTSYPGGQPRPLASTLNLDGPGHTAANLTIVPVRADGTVSFFSQSGTHLLADVTGYVTDASSGPSSGGLFVPLQPIRMFDTRTGGGSPVAAGGSIDVLGAVGDISSTAWAVVANLTATESAAPGYFTGWAHGQPRPLASNLNLTEAGETRANAALLPVGDDGRIDLFSQSGAHLLADAFGYLLPAAPSVAYFI